MKTTLLILSVVLVAFIVLNLKKTQELGNLVLDSSYDTPNALTPAKIKHSERPIIINFTTEWCSDSRNLKSNLKQVLKQSELGLDVVHLDPEERMNRDLVAKYNIRQVPTLLFVKNGQLQDSFTGPLDLKTLETKVKSLL